MQLDVASPAAVTASTTGIAAVKSVVEITAASVVSLVRSWLADFAVSLTSNLI